jgi:hypothetical protein
MLFYLDKVKSIKKSPTFQRPSPPPLSGDPLMMEADMVSETLGFCPQVTRLVAREDFTEFSRSESFKSYINKEITLLCFNALVLLLSTEHQNIFEFLKAYQIMCILKLS